MEPSQLRRLARAHADGQLDTATYRRQRRALIAAVEAGETALIRSAPPVLVADEGFEQRPPPRPRTAPRGLPGRRVGVLIALVVAGFLAYLLWPAPQPSTPAGGVVVPTRQVPVARTLVESFLAVHDWSEESLSRFESQWATLPAPEREAARGALWFERLDGAVRSELETQQALSRVDHTGQSAAAIERIETFAARLGLPGAGTATTVAAAPAAVDRPPTPAPSAPVPQSRDPAVSALPAAPTSAGATAPALPVRTPDVPSPSASTDERPTVPSAPRQLPAPTPSARPAPPSPGSGRDWLTSQPGGNVTLQLFAVDHLDRVERLLSTHPDAGLRVIESPGTSPRYRVVVGSFPDADAAREAAARLPAEIRAAQPEPLVRRLSDLTPGATAVSSPAPAPPPSGFTLQLLATASAENAERLVASQPALGLRLVRLTGDPLPLRVVLGRYPSEDAARDAARGLPESVLSATGQPLVKSLSELTP
ncbi:MAG: SPOR domain-containing protein [Ectothiorhodospiraceae bacterium]|nr:SPOR domain-containing protein [Chromatiales bacterium]MCP5155674.1 SPOR domain-containing protein [Ectothiorhodospiraceae bacterium]